MPATPKVIAASWNGGTAPLRAVSAARLDQSSTARKPEAVAARRERRIV
jgi:hypothetical protein